MMETLPIIHVITRLNFAAPVPRPQTFTLAYRKTGASAWTPHPQPIDTDGEGVLTAPVEIAGLDPDTDYQFRYTNTLTGGEFTQTVRTAYNLTAADNPLYLTRLYQGQAVDLYETGLRTASLPANYNGFYYPLDGRVRDAFEGYANIVPQGEPVYSVGANTVNSKQYSGMLFDGVNFAAFNNIHPEAAARVNAAQMFDVDGSRAYSLFIWFYNRAGTGNTKTIIATGTGQNFFRVDIVAGVVTIRTRQNIENNEVITAVAPITYGNWYLLEIRRDPVTPSAGTVYLHSDAGGIAFDGHPTINMNGSETDTVFMGYDTAEDVIANGLILRCIYYAATATLTATDRDRILDPDAYLPRLILQPLPSGAEIVNPSVWNLSLSDVVYSTVLDPDTPSGDYEIFVRNADGEGARHTVAIAGFTARATGFDVDFSTDFDAAVGAFKAYFVGLENQWGGANGGVKASLIYADRTEGALVFEQHGDLYDGTVQGADKPYRDSRNTGFGAPKFHTHPGDPEFGQPWTRRVGAVAVSRDYCGYGEWDTWLKVPVGAYGVAPALWFFHYQELYPTDPRWNYWIGRGGKPYEGEDPYLVINNEIDMELPSHIAMGEFSDWAEVGSVYFDPLALDTQYHIAVKDAADRGLYRLANTTTPNSRTSWVKVADTWDVVDTPKFSNCKFNNWRGEKSSGNGWAATAGDYSRDEEYLALLTKLDQSYADGQYHKWTIRWYKDRTELLIDDVLIRTNRAFVPYIAGRLTLGGWFPSAVVGGSATPWEYTPARAWAGHPAAFKFLHLHVSRIRFRPFSETEAGGTIELHNETYPEAGLREFA